MALVERHLGVRSGLRQLLDEAPGLMLAAEASYAGELLAGCRDTAWDVALLDVSPRDESGQATLRALRQRCPDLPLVAMTFVLDTSFLHECLSAGASGLVAVDDLVEEVVPALLAVAAGRAYLSAAARRALDEGQPPD